jgi:hypothetical protein
MANPLAQAEFVLSANALAQLPKDSLAAPMPENRPR